MIYYTSDLHLGHRFVSGLRGYEEAAHHDAAIIEHWHRTIESDDVVYVLGDLSMNAQHGIDIIASLPGRKRLITGNHDKCHPMFRDAPKWYARYSSAFEYIAPFGRRRINGHNVLMSHYPYLADRGTPRDLQWRLPHHGDYLLHGHTHENVIHTSATEIHVGWDAWNRLIPEYQIGELIHG